MYSAAKKTNVPDNDEAAAIRRARLTVIGSVELTTLAAARVRAVKIPSVTPITRAKT
jgi:hypothetical protein